MSAAPSSSSAKSSVDVRTLSLVQLQKLAERGSRRAKAELEGRMRAATGSSPAAMPSATPPRPTSAPRPPAGPIPTLTERAVAAPLRGAVDPPLAPPAPADDPAPAPHDALVQQLELIARQDEARSRADGPPRLVGLVLIAWGVMLMFGGLVMLSRGGGLYYLLCGVGSAAVGWLLLQCSRWAMVLHGVLLLVALAWAWQIAKGSFGLALVQAAPVWIAALWMAVRSVREPLE
ncbi:hypothetical protein [Ottowia beijingensis]|uniref:hypothetical protein n=1 Tax=Ottowia beijingensis TaxID=1207057 RepID=UPI0036453913